MRVAINGFGRIGNVVFRIMNEMDDIDIVAINYRHEPKELAYTLKYDTCHRRFSGMESQPPVKDGHQEF